MSNSRRWREFISWWNTVSLEEYLYNDTKVLIHAINKKIDEIKRNKNLTE